MGKLEDILVKVVKWLAVVGAVVALLIAVVGLVIALKGYFFNEPKPPEPKSVAEAELTDKFSVDKFKDSYNKAESAPLAAAPGDEAKPGEEKESYEKVAGETIPKILENFQKISAAISHASANAPIQATSGVQASSVAQDASAVQAVSNVQAVSKQAKSDKGTAPVQKMPANMPPKVSDVQAPKTVVTKDQIGAAMTKAGADSDEKKIIYLKSLELFSGQMVDAIEQDSALIPSFTEKPLSVPEIFNWHTSQIKGLLEKTDKQNSERKLKFEKRVQDYTLAKAEFPTGLTIAIEAMLSVFFFVVLLLILVKLDSILDSGKKAHEGHHESEESPSRKK